MSNTLLLSFIIFVVAFGLSKLVITLLSKHLLDHPNQRSSHSTPTPRGGGIAISGSVLSGLFLLSSNDAANSNLLLLIPSSGIFLLGLADDFLNLNIRLRLGIQLLLSVWASQIILPIAPNFSALDIAIACCSVLLLAGAANLYNFMDGINGLAASQAISVSLGMLLIYWIRGGIAQEDSDLLIIIAAGCAGFLYWNFPHAKLFMGDSGSLLLGFTLMLMALKQLDSSFALFFSWIILMGGFFVDAGMTLMVRILNKQKFYLPHRSHAYQKAASKLKSHTRVTLIFIAINCFWLLPIGLLVSLGKLNPLLGLGIAYLPLIWSHIKIKGGHALS